MAGSAIGVAQYNGLLHSLKPQNPELDELADAFLRAQGKPLFIDLVCYYETEATTAVPGIRVCNT